MSRVERHRAGPLLWVIAVLLVVSGCADRSGGAARGSQVRAPKPLAAWAALPFGLRQAPGTAPVGRPIVADEDISFWNNQLVRGRSLRVGYRLDPATAAEAVTFWLNQLAVLGLGPSDPVSLPDSRTPWMRMLATSWSTTLEPGPGTGSADLQLWRTNRGAVLLVTVSQFVNWGTSSPGTAAQFQLPPPPRPQVTEVLRGPGETFFTEQGDDIRVPDGSEQVLGTIPTSAGTGGSTSVLAARDQRAAVDDLLAQARAVGKGGDVSPPVVEVVDGMTIVSATFVIGAGGWGFNVYSTRGPGDPYATIWITSYAD